MIETEVCEQSNKESVTPCSVNPPGSSVHGILQGRIVVQLLSCAQLFPTPWTATHQARVFLLEKCNELQEYIDR